MFSKDQKKSQPAPVYCIGDHSPESIIMRFSIILFVVTVSLFYFSTSGSGAELKPLLAVAGEVVMEVDFSEAGPVSKEDWLSRQGTRWEIAEGVLQGQPSSSEYQASKSDHKGYEPRTSVPKTPQEFMAKFSVRFLEGEETSVVPFVEFGHHVCRVKFSAEGGTVIVADGESVKVAEAVDFKYMPGKWYHVMAEMKGEDFVIQFAEGPTLYATHACFGEANPSGGNGLGIAGPKGGRVEVDEVTIWSIKAGEEQKGWKKKRLGIPVIEAVPTGKAKKGE
jgi:hypothetical protein